MCSLLACGPSSLEISIWGEELIEEGIPAQSPGVEVGFTDGWAVKFERFELVLGQLSLATRDGTSTLKTSTAAVFDLVAPGAKPVHRFDNVPAVRFDDVGYSIAPKDNLLGGTSVAIRGTATKGDVSKHFDWVFETSTDYHRCHSPESTDGAALVVQPQSVEKAQITIHGDHLFYDDLVSPESKVRFQAYADADADRDGSITMDELAVVNLTTLPSTLYGTGSTPNVKTLKDFITALTRTLGHFQGEGECVPQAR